MSGVLQAITRHLDDLANNRVPAREKPKALHYGMLTQAAFELQRLTTTPSSNEITLAQALIDVRDELAMNDDECPICHWEPCEDHCDVHLARRILAAKQAEGEP